jgi:hypothetical protein
MWGRYYKELVIPADGFEYKCAGVELGSQANILQGMRNKPAFLPRTVPEK